MVTEEREMKGRGLEQEHCSASLDLLLLLLLLSVLAGI